MGVAIDVAEAEFEERVVRASHEAPVVVDFWAGWCRPCLVLGPILEKLAEEHGGRFVLAKVDVDANQALAGSFGVQGIPAVKAFVDGRVVDEFVGAQPEEVVRGWLKGFVASPAEGVVAAARDAADPADAEALYRWALDEDPDHEGAATGLASILLRSERAEEARSLLARFPGSAEARRLLAEADLAAGAGDLERLRAEHGPDPEDPAAALALAAAEAAAGSFGDALERALRIVLARGDAVDESRDLMVRVFELLGEEHPLVHEYRRRLASALY